MRLVRIACVLAACVTAAAVAVAGEGGPTFNVDVAPVVHRSCAPCHHPGGSGPFPLLTYDDVRKRARQVADVTRTRFMPPWLPEPGHGEFAGERRLASEEIRLLAEWVAAGTPEGDPSSKPVPPGEASGWRLGEPDLVIEMEQPYELRADGPDVFRNFVIAVPVTETRYVRALELRPGNPRILHHAVMRTDESRSSRLQAASDPEPGFGSMNMGDARAPDDFLLAWTPGSVPDPGNDEFAWTLRPGTDLVLQLHLQPSGRPETVRPRVAFYFAERPPARVVASVVLRAREIDIPAGEASYRVTDHYTLPVDVELLSIYPHAHYLGKRFESWAELPDGSREWLIKIDDWDFNWQDEYRYARPVKLPAGTTVHAVIVYDNTAANPRNPHDPPQRVRGGSRSVDEMGTLTLQVVPADAPAKAALHESLTRQDLQKDPGDWLAHHNMAIAAHDAGRVDESVAHYREALRLNPTRTAAYNNLALILESKGDLAGAVELLQRALELNPGYADGHYNLGRLLQLGGDARSALEHYQRSIALRPNHAAARHNVGLLLLQQGRLDAAAEQLEAARSLDPNDAEVHVALGNVRAARGEVAAALAHYRQALALGPASSELHNNLANVLLQLGHVGPAIEHYRRALTLEPDMPDARYNLTEAMALKAEIDAAIAEGQQRVTATQGRHVGAWMELADTYASAGHMEEALEAAQRGLNLASAAGEADLAERIRRRMQLYRELPR